jgi:putative hydrolase of the HAD superfamily
VVKLTTLLFDFVGVLLEYNPETIVTPLVREIGRNIGEVTDDQLFRESILHDYALSPAQFETILDEIVSQFRPFQPLWHMLPGLRKKYRLAIINNGTFLTFTRFNAKYTLDQRFDGFISSAQEGVKKPDSRIFQRACEKLQVRPEECLFMDDSQDNVTGAIQVGMNAIWWVNHAAGFAQFQELLTDLAGQ